MTDFRDHPHIYYKKKYIGLHFQGVARGNTDFHFSGGKGIEGCIKLLNNTNSIIGNIHIMCSYLCKTLGIKQSFYKEEPEDHSNPGLLSLIREKPNIDTHTLEERITELEKVVAQLDKKVSTLDLRHIETIMAIVKNIDEKV